LTNTVTGNKSVNTSRAHREHSLVSTISLIVLAACLFMLVVMTIVLYQGFMATGENGVLTYFVGILAIAVFIWLCTSLTLRFGSPRKPKPAHRDEVLEALIATIRTNPDPEARLAAVKGLSELDLEESAEHMRHENIDAILISVLQTDPDSRVRSAAAEGLSVVELEKHSYYHTHDKLYGTLLKHGIEA
jgi:uncharacterized membrane protein